MPSFQFKKIDAFATPSSAGNPAGLVLLDSPESISDAQMQRIAAELQGFVSEVAFLSQTAPGVFHVRYFSSEREVQFCGHATVGMMYDLIKADPVVAQHSVIQLHTNKGVLPVENKVAQEDAVFIHAPTPIYSAIEMGLDEICLAMNIALDQIDQSVPLGLVNAGNQTLCIPMQSLSDVTELRPDFDAVLKFCQRFDLDVITIFTTDTANPQNQIRSRVFAATFGYLEDPATGSGNAALGYHLHRIGKWDGSAIRIEQNAELSSPNIVSLASIADLEHGIRVIFGGGAVTRISGQYHL